MAEHPGAAPLRARVSAQARAETITLLRRGENLFFVLVLPVLFLVFFSKVEIGIGRTSVGELMAPILTMAIMSSAFVGLSISTAFERKYLVLKRLGLSPLGRSGLVSGKLLAVGVVEIIQIAVLWFVGAVFLRWKFRGDPASVALFLVAGSAAFGSAGLFLAGTLRAEGTLAVSNAIYALLLLFGGVVVPLEKLPAVAAALGGVLPSAALAHGLGAAIEGAPLPGRDLVTLVVASVLFTGLAVKTFRWE